TANAQVGIGTTNPDASAILELEATDKGLLPPRITTAQRDAISNPAVGLMIFNTDENCMQWYDTNGWYDGCSGATYPFVASLDCANATNNGTLAVGQAANSVDSEIAYTGGNGLSHSGQTVNSTGVTGLTATLAPGTLATGAGSLTYTISGTPASDGTASFAINIGGQTCSLERTVIPPPPQVGDFREGGVVFYIFNSNDPGYVAGETHGLVAAIEDQSSSAEWGCYGTSISGADGNGIGSGTANTSAILDDCSQSGIAAELCDNYSGGGYSDWFLPSKDELSLMYQNKTTIDDTAVANGGNSFSADFYWSSTEFSSNNAWAYHMLNDALGNYEKNIDYFIVRAVRAF
ncbi:Lcl C-terminal domain-containing protein, partial [Psychroflexus maritimus]